MQDGTCLPCSAADGLFYDEEAKACKSCDEVTVGDDFELEPLTVLQTQVPFDMH